MTIPDYQMVMLPLLKLAADGEERRLRAAIEELTNHFDLTEDERKELPPSGSRATFDNRVGWARTYTKKAGLLECATHRTILAIASIASSSLRACADRRVANVSILDEKPI